MTDYHRILHRHHASVIYRQRVKWRRLCKMVERRRYEDWAVYRLVEE